MQSLYGMYLTYVNSACAKATNNASAQLFSFSMFVRLVGKVLETI